ncbi:hypothetical protein M3Y94_00367400 [Aphelenchoides besseyi]|nr:hypothetical protein M3Y94_00367400 [Aphelenchoides besseyi]KAI6235206.1 Arrestin domain-containing protein 15 [Aphelenchoides besseyi]
MASLVPPPVDATTINELDFSATAHKTSIFHWDAMPTVALNFLLNTPRVYTGDYLDAKILLDSSDPSTMVREFVAEIRCVGRCGWINIHTDKIYETDREYFQTTIPLCPYGKSIDPGRNHQFPLRVKIPENLPSSYESQFGAIRYTVRVILLTNSEQATAVEIFPFHVIASSTFDEIPAAVLQPIDYKDEIDFTVCSLPFGTIFLKIILSRSGYCLGETITPLIHIRNSSRKALTDCSVQLVMKTQFTATSRYEHVNDKKVVEERLDCVPLGRIKGRSEMTFNSLRLRIPANTIPSTSTRDPDSNSIIVATYVFKFEGTPGIETEIPLIITTLGNRNQSNMITSHKPVYKAQAPFQQNRDGSVHYL